MTAKFRQNHIRSNPFSGLFVRVIAFAIILILGFVYIYRFLDNSLGPQNEYKQHELKSNPEDRDYLPSNSGQVIHHQYYSLSYAESHEQAEWVSYRLTEESLRIPNVPRHDHFMADYKVNTRSAFHRDYSGSGYTRGHLAPAGDMAFDSTAMRESFYMSNISPQIRAFNNGIWKELEEQTRDWAFHNDELIVVSGPVLKHIEKKIGKQNRISVPKHFYKILYDQTGSSRKAIGFLIPHERSDRPLQDYAVSIDSIESITGIDFFPNLDQHKTGERIEANVDPNDWKFSQKRYDLRVKRWNYE